MLVKSKMKIVFWFFYLWKTKIANRLKIPVTGREGKSEVARLLTRWRSSCSEGVFRVACLHQAVSSGNVTPTGSQSLPVSWPARFQRIKVNIFSLITLQHYSTQGKAFQIGQYKRQTADCGLRTADCGLRTADCGLRTADCGLRTADCRLRTADHGQRTGYM